MTPMASYSYKNQFGEAPLTVWVLNITIPLSVGCHTLFQSVFDVGNVLPQVLESRRNMLHHSFVVECRGLGETRQTHEDGNGNTDQLHFVVFTNLCSSSQLGPG